MMGTWYTWTKVMEVGGAGSGSRMVLQILADMAQTNSIVQFWFILCFVSSLKYISCVTRIGHSLVLSSRQR